MLAFVEGELSSIEEVSFRRGLRHAPQVLAGLEAMRRDKGLLRATMLREALVPSSLSARVEEAIGREALFGAMSSPELQLVESTLQTRVSTRWWASRRINTGLAVAAGLALAIGGSVLVVNRPSGSAPRGGPNAPRSIASAAGDRSLGYTASVPSGESIEQASGSAPQPGAPDGTPPGSAHGAGDSNLTVALGSDPAGSAPALSPSPSIEASLPLDGPAAPFEAPGLAPTRMLPGTVARQDVMRLAEQHRLALRVSADEPRAVIAALESAATSGEGSQGNAGGPGWRILADAPATLASSLSVTIRPFDESALAGPGAGAGSDPDSGRGNAPSAPAMAPGSGAGPDDAWLLRPTADALAVYLAEVDMTPEGLSALGRELSARAGTRSGFAALADPLDHAIGDMGLLVPAREVIWWYHPPREWSRRTLVPVVVERR